MNDATQAARKRAYQEFEAHRHRGEKDAVLAVYLLAFREGATAKRIEDRLRSFRPPELAMERLEVLDIRDEQGCRACIHRGEEAFGLVACKLKNVANRRGFCRRWKLDEEVV